MVVAVSPSRARRTLVVNSPYDEKPPELTYPKPREPDIFLQFMAVMGMGYMALNADGFWTKLMSAAVAAYAIWRYFADARRHTIDLLEYRRAQYGVWALSEPDDQSAQTLVRKNVNRINEKIEIIKSHKWRLSEPTTLEERHEGERARELEKQRLRRVKQLKKGLRVMIRYEKLDRVPEYGTVTKIDKKFNVFWVQWDIGEERAYYFADLEYIEIAP